MRLTLRTLLAYMDQILDPPDHEELGRKIESSDFATELIHRTRDVLRRLRLGAPEVDDGDNDEVLGGSPNLDANAVAEYLDNTMPPEQVAEFERCCLETGTDADMRLAEVASCHHVLTMVLGEPVEVKPEVRQRMYALKEQADAASATGATDDNLRTEPPLPPSESETIIAAAPPIAPVVTESIAAKQEKKEEVPDYLRAAAQAERRGRKWRFAAVAAALVVGAGLTYLFWPQPEPKVPDHLAEVDTDSLSDSLTVDGEAGAATETEAGISGEDAGEAPAYVPPTASAPPEDESTAAATTDETEAIDLQPMESVPGVELPPIADLTGDDLPGDDQEIATEDGQEIDAPSEVMETAETEVVVEDDATGSSVEIEENDSTGVEPDGAPESLNPLTMNNDPPTASPDLPPGIVEGDSALATSDVPPVPPTLSEGVSAPEGTATGEPPKPVQLGNYLGNNDVLLRFDPTVQTWQRLPTRTALAADDKLLVLPAFRAHLGLASGVNAALSGGSQLTLAPIEVPVNPAGDAPQPADVTLRLDFGRLLLVAGLEGSRVNLVLGDQTYDLELGPSTSLAVAAQRRFVPGGDTQSLGPMDVHWYLTSGDASWSGGEAQGAFQWTSTNGTTSQPEPLQEMPDWIDREPITELERGASEQVAENINVGDPVNIRLLELADMKQLGRRSEVRTLAVESGAYVGVFEPFVKALNDEKQRANWDELISTMRQAIARDPKAADLLYEDYVNLRGDREAADLMQMLLGYDLSAIGTTAEQRKEGAFPQLIRWLDSDQLDYRVLASYNLKDITGKNLGGYRPERTARQRRISVARYWDDLDKGLLKPRGEE